MVSTIVKQYKITNLTNSNVTYQWDVVDPSTNIANNNIIYNVEYVSGSENQFYKLWSENNIDTKRGFCAESRDLQIAANSNIQHFDLQFPIPVSLCSVFYTVKSEHINDVLECQYMPDTIIGTIVKDVNPGDNIIYVTDSVMNHCHPGYNISLQNNQSIDDMDICISIDINNKFIVCAKSAQNFYSSDNCTKVKMTCKTMKNFSLQAEGSYDIGRNAGNGRYIPANSVFRLLYKNNTPDVSKLFHLFFEYTY